MMIGYPIVDKKYMIHRTPGEGFLNGTKATVKELTFERIQNFYQGGRLMLPETRTINKSACAFLCHCNGTLSFDDIINKLQRFFNVDRETVIRSIKDFVDEAQSNGHISIQSQKKASPEKIKITGSFDYWMPVHAMLELTDYCDLECKYCYREALTYQQNEHLPRLLPLEKTLEMYQKLADKGVVVVELTGGEPLIHPHAKEIYDFCAQKFYLLSVTTNGTHVTDELAQSIAQHGNTIVSLSLDGACEETVAKVTGRPGTFKKVVDGISTLAKYKVAVRASMTVTKLNIDEVEETLLLARDLGASAFTPAMPMLVGRANNNSDVIFQHGKEMLHADHRIKSIAYDYEEFIAKAGEEVYKKAEKQESCGSCTRSATISPKGDVRFCAVATEAPWSVVGNIIDEPYEQVFNNPKINFFRSLKWPAKERCVGCDMLGYCAKCVVRGMSTARERDWDCKWAKEQNIMSYMDEFAPLSL